MLSYLFLFAMLLVIVPFLIHRVILSKKKPPYFSENDAGHERISVYVWTPRSRRPDDYREYLFVRRKNGKYRMKLRFREVICIVIPVFQLCFGTFLISLFKDEFIKHPDTIPALAGFFIWLISLIVFANYPQIEARIYFRKNIDDFLNGDRRY